MSQQEVLREHAQAMARNLIQGEFDAFADRFVPGGVHVSCTAGYELDDSISGTVRGKQAIANLAQGWVNLTTSRELTNQQFVLHPHGVERMRGVPLMPYAVSINFRYRAVLAGSAARPVVVVVNMAMHMDDQGRVAWVQANQFIYLA